MKDFLLFLFYQAIVAVNTAVILIGIIWIVKRKDEKDGRKPSTTWNFGITADTAKEPESAKPHEEDDFINAKCGDCKHYANSLDGGYCVLRRCQVKAHEKWRCYFFKKYEAPVRTTHICKNCKHYLATEEESVTGLCGMNDEITFGNNYRACFEKREGKDHE